MKVGVIGATGHVGATTVKELLRRGHEVKAMARHADKIEPQDRLELVNADVLSATFGKELEGLDAVVSTFGVKLEDPNAGETYRKGMNNIINAAIKTNVPYLLIVGGAGSLYLKPGLQLADSPAIPPQLFPAVDAARRYFESLHSRRDVNWAYFSPAAAFGTNWNFDKTGDFRLGKDDVLFYDDGTPANLTVGDMACILTDDVEAKGHLFTRFTAATNNKWY